jgi:hypothetical protein
VTDERGGANGTIGSSTGILSIKLEVAHTTIDEAAKEAVDNAHQDVKRVILAAAFDKVFSAEDLGATGSDVGDSAFAKSLWNAANNISNIAPIIDAIDNAAKVCEHA